MPRDTINLHAYWDGVLTRANPGATPADVARGVMSAFTIATNSPDVVVQRGPLLASTIGRWADESATLARYVAYDIDERLDGAAPPRTSAAYDLLAEAIARQRIALAGYRLAALLETALN
jgi:hypothetical protein